ncbi:MAG: glycosyltransferase [Candidatus Omnitrophica bacterium]|nr:glycosyltransferase [Candidatus Omnitrophota bacterium]
MQTKPNVSVLMLTADHHVPFIGKAIESVLGQTYQNWELIILDDGPGYKAKAVVEQYTDPRLRYFSQTHRGPKYIADSFNNLFSLAQADFIGILEGDDLWVSHKLERQLEILSKDDNAALCHGIVKLIDSRDRIIRERNPTIKRVIREHPEWLYNRPVGAALNGILFGTFISTASLLIRINLEKSVDFKRLRMAARA